MTVERYPIEELSEDDDNGTMPRNVAELTEHIVGHRIMSAEMVTTANRWGGDDSAFEITLDNGKKVRLADTDDCCAYTALQSFLLNADKVDHIITGVGTTNGFQTWHIFADMGDVLALEIGWSSGNPFYYGYGFDITVEQG